MNNFAKFKRLTPADRRLALHMLALVSIVRLGLALFSLKTVQRRLKALAYQYPVEPERLNIERSAYMIGLISFKLLTDGPCLTQALAMQWMLARARLPADLRVGMMKSPEGKLLAHAWVESDGTVLIGGPVDDYQVMRESI